MKRIGIITSSEQPGLLQYDRDIATLLSKSGISSEPVIWDEPHLPWENYDMLLMRTAWGYHQKPFEFKNLLEYFALNKFNIWNPATVMLENMHKFYLKRLAEAGFNVIPTLFCEPREFKNIENLIKSTGWERCVIKPAISASAFDTHIISDINGLKKINGLDERYKGRQFLLQKYIPEIEQEGEWSIFFFSNGFKYSVLKVPQKGDYRVQIEYGGKYYRKHAPDFIFESAKKIVDFYMDNCLYIRVDGVVSQSKFLVMEVEMIEPHLFMDLVPEAKEPFVEVIIQKLNSYS
ncbi:MAG: hypothetical protein EPN82_13325 [Bacteroidetes bacterium]|nr:MAG: hypothetical protein EPN82_13325 [Bacteroidota bacterium]